MRTQINSNAFIFYYFRLEVNIDDADSDDEDPYQGDPMMEMKDPYVLRSLPFLIGSQDFHQSDNVGLVDLPSGNSILIDLLVDIEHSFSLVGLCYLYSHWLLIMSFFVLIGCTIYCCWSGSALPLANGSH